MREEGEGRFTLTFQRTHFASCDVFSDFGQPTIAKIRNHAATVDRKIK